MTHTPPHSGRYSSRTLRSTRTFLSLQKIASTGLALFLCCQPLAPVFAEEPEDAPPAETESSSLQSPPSWTESPDATEAPSPFPFGETTRTEPQPQEESTATAEIEPVGESMQSLSAGSDPSPLGTKRGEKTTQSSSINEQDGALVYAYPLAVPPGRNGVQPELVLSYNSSERSAYDFFGFGWSLNLPYIERLHKTGSQALHTGNTYTSSLSGELVQVGSTTEYRPRIETGDFLKYVLSNSIWKITDKNGTIYTLGSTTASRQDNAASTTQIYRWMVDEIRDTNDNYIKYTYYKSQNQIYPESIIYTGTGSTDGIFSVDFTKSTTTHNSVKYTTGFAATTTYQISEIQVKQNGSWLRKYTLGYTDGDNDSRKVLDTIVESGRREGETATTTLPQIDFEYQETMSADWTEDTSWTVPVAFTQQGRDIGTREVDVNGDGFVDIIRFFRDQFSVVTKEVYLNNHTDGWDYDTSFDWSNMTVPFSEYTVIGASELRNDQGTRFADVNGDGLTDAITAFEASSTPNNKLAVYLNTGTGWSQSSTWEVPLFFTRYNASRNWDNGVRLADINGDGLADFVQAYMDSASTTISKVFLNTGSAWATSTTFVVPEPFTMQYDITNQGKDLGTQLVDVNGDGLVDVVRGFKDINFGNTKKTYLNTGTSWTLNSVWTLPDYLVWDDEMVSDVGFRFEDVNDDGLVDIAIENNATGTIPNHELYVNTGAGWTSSIGQYPTLRFSNWTAGALGDYGTRFMDVNADRRADLVRGWTDNTTDYAVTEEEVYINRRPSADLLSHIEEPQGGTVDVGYMSSHEYREGGLPSLNLPFALTTVASTSYSSGFGNTWEETYAYRDGLYWYEEDNLTDRRFAGFHSIAKTTDAGTETTYFHQGNESNGSDGEYRDSFSKIGFPYRTEIADNAGNVYKVLARQWDEVSLGTSTSFIQETKTLTQDYDGDADHKDTATTYTYDTTTGSLLEKVEWGEVEATTTISNPSKSLVLDSSSSQYASISDASQTGLDLSGNFSIESWINLDSLPSTGVRYGIASKYRLADGTNTQFSYYLFYENSGGTKRLGLFLWDGSHFDTLYQNVNLSTGVWYHIAATYNATTDIGKFYKDGTQLGSDMAGTQVTIMNNSAAFGVGVSGSSAGAAEEFFDGKVDELRVWNTERSATEITTNKSLELTGAETGLKAYWKFGGNAIDETTGNNDLTTSGGPTYSTDVPFSGDSEEVLLTFTDVGTDKRTTQYTYASSTALHIVVPKTETLLDRASSTVSASRFYYDIQALGTVTKGNLTKHERLASSTANYIDEEWTYGSYGLVSQSKDPRDNATTYTYDTYNLYPATTTNSLSHTVGKTFDYSSGKVSTTTDPNGRTFVTRYDGLDRPTEEKIPDPTSGSSVTKTTYTYIDTKGARRLAIKNYLNSATTTDTYEYYDGFGRKVQTRTEAETTNQFSVRDFEYGTGGLLERESLPYFSTGTARTGATTNDHLYTTYTYDPLRRPSTHTTVMGSTVTAYDQWTESVTDTENNLKEFTYDAFGRLGTTTEHNGASAYATTYAWTPHNNLATITDALGNVRAITYDSLGRRSALQDLHATADTTYGTWRFTYDNAGNLSSSTDPKSQTVQYTYDALNRVLTENYTGTAGTEVTYTYDTGTDGKGRLYRVTNNSATTTFAYTPHGLTDIATTTVGTTSYAANYDYDRMGNQTILTYPDNSSVRYTYNTAGYLEKVEQKESAGAYQSIVSNFNYGPHGMVTYQLHGNGASTTKIYDPYELYRLRSTVTSVPPHGGGGEDLRTLESALFGVEEPLNLLDALATTSFGGVMDDEEYLSQLPAEDSLILEDEATTTDEDIGEIPEATSTPTLPDIQAATTHATSAPEETPALPVSDPASTSPEIGEEIATTSLIAEVLATTTATTTTPRDTILTEFLGATAKETAFLKASALAKISSLERQRVVFGDADYDIEVVSTNLVEDGIEVFARAWMPDGTPIGFGVDGSVEIERFRIFNPPVLVKDETGDVARVVTDTETGEYTVQTYRVDPVLAMLQTLAHTLEVKEEKFLDTAIETGKVGNTTSIIYSTTGDGYAVNNYSTNTGTPWSSERSGAGVSFDKTSATTEIVRATGDTATSTWRQLTRAGYYFDTSPIGSNVIHSAILSLYITSKSNTLATAPTTNVYSFAPETTSIQAGDFDQFGDTEFSTTKSYASLTAAAYTSFTLNTLGKAYLDPAGTTALGIRNANYDVASTAPTWSSGGGYTISGAYADTVGTTNDPKLTIEHSATTTFLGTSILQSFVYEYDSVGNITRIVDNSGTLSGSVTLYTYDDLYRLTSASTTIASTTPFTQTYTYNAIGNITTKSDVGTYLYQGDTGSLSANPHAPTSINGVTYAYDRTGNLATTSAGLTNTWTYNNRLEKSVEGATTTNYLYDHTGMRVQKGSASTGTTTYPFSFYELTTSTTTKHIYAGGALLATLDTRLGSTTTFHVHPDHLGSTHIVTTSTGGLDQVLAYYPFGSPRIQRQYGSLNQKNRYVGQEYDQETNLNYLQQRYQNSLNGQFVSLDPSFLDIGVPRFEQNYGRSLQMHLMNPQALNSYSYGLNNPITNSDPKGEIVPLIVLGALAFYGGYSAGTDLYEGYTSGDGGQFAWGVVGAGASLIPGGSTAKGAVSLTDDALKVGIKLGEAGGSGAGKTFAKSVKDLAYEQAKGKCVFCGVTTPKKTPGPTQANTDHSIPRVQGGNNTINNAQNTCRSCNLSKGASNSLQFVQKQLIKTLKAYIKKKTGG